MNRQTHNRLDRDFRLIASKVGKSQDTLRSIHRCISENDMNGILDPLELCEELYGYLRDIQHTVSIMLAINNGIYKPKKHLGDTNETNNP